MVAVSRLGRLDRSNGQRMPDEIGRKEYGRNRIPVAERLILFPCPVPCAVMMAICPMRSALRLFHLFT